MEILINGQKADITLENEKTVGDICAGLEQWLANSGFRLSGLAIDGEVSGASTLNGFFCRGLEGIGTLDIFTSSLSELAAQAIECLLQDIDGYEVLDFGEKREFFSRWKTSPQADVLAEQDGELSLLCENTFSGGDTGTGSLRAIAEERLREIRLPVEELARCQPLIQEICARLEDLPLDIQTGKDGRAAQTIQLFSGIAEKFFRIFSVLKTAGLAGGAVIDGVSASDYIVEFGAALKELIAAYGQKDVVLVGDLAEYELAPRLRQLYGAIKESI